jgi:hypothetical protein
MKTTDEIIKDCFKKAKMENVPSDRTAYLFKILCDEFNLHFNKVKSKHEERYLFELVSEGYVLSLGDYSISASNGDIANKDLILSTYFEKRGFNTVKGAMKYIENNS